MCPLLLIESVFSFQNKNFSHVSPSWFRAVPFLPIFGILILTSLEKKNHERPIRELVELKKITKVLWKILEIYKEQSAMQQDLGYLF